MKEVLSAFLLGAYFGVDVDEVDRPEGVDENRKMQIALSCAELAYRDFNRTLRFNKTGKEPHDSKQRKDFRSSMCKRVVAGIKRLWETTDQFDRRHHELCLNLIKEATDYPSEGGGSKLLQAAARKKGRPGEAVKPFYYGQAQKWLNMTIKYMWILGLWDVELATVKSMLHVPVDSYILRAAAAPSMQESGTKLWLGIKVPKRYFQAEPGHDQMDFIPLDELCEQQRQGDYQPYRGSEHQQPWSRWSHRDYMLFQYDLRKKLKERHPALDPIDWEGKVWLEQAMSSR